MAPLKKTGFHWWAAAREAALDFRFVQVFEPFNTKRKRESQKRTNVPPHPPKWWNMKYHRCCKWKSLFYHPGGKTGPIRAYPPVAVPTDGTPQIPVWRQGPQQPGTAWGTWSTADQPGWAGSGSTCTGTTLHLQGQKSRIIYRDTTAVTGRTRQRLPTSVHRLMVKERRGKWGSATKIKQQNVSRITAGSPRSPSQKYTQAAMFAPASPAAALVLFYQSVWCSGCARCCFHTLFFFFVRRKHAEQEWKLDFRETKQGGRSGGEDTTVFLYRVWMSVNKLRSGGGWKGDKEDEMSREERKSRHG